MTTSALGDHRAAYSEFDPAYEAFVARRESIVAAALVRWLAWRRSWCILPRTTRTKGFRIR